MICENSCCPCFQHVVAAATWHDVRRCWDYGQPAAQSHLLLEATLSSLQCAAFLICHCCVWLSSTGTLSPFEINTAQWLRTKAFPDQWDVISHTASGQWTPYILKLHLKASIFLCFCSSEMQAAADLSHESWKKLTQSCIFIGFYKCL